MFRIREKVAKKTYVTGYATYFNHHCCDESFTGAWTKCFEIREKVAKKRYVTGYDTAFYDCCPSRSV